MEKKSKEVDSNLNEKLNTKNEKNSQENFILELKESIDKLKFRKCLDEIRDKQTLFEEYQSNWKINELKIQCMMQIVNKKFIKYHGINKIKGLDNWIMRIDEELTKWIDALNCIERIQDNDFLVQLELCIKYVLEQCYNYAYLMRTESNISDCASYLALGERLIKFSSEFTNNPENLNISVKLLLFISSLLISDSEFEIAKLYQTNALKLCYRELNFRIDLEEDINLKKLTNKDQESLEKIFLNMIMSFYQMGVCEESLGNVSDAIHSYKQSKWFSSNFISNSMPELTQLIAEIEKRAINNYSIIQSLKNKESRFNDNKLINQNKRQNRKLFYDEYDSLKKFQTTRKLLENLKINEIDDDDTQQEKKSGKVKNILSTVKIVNHLMSDQFKNILISFDKININHLDKNFKEKIQKQLNMIKAEKIYLEKEKYTKVEEEKKNSKKINFKENYKNSLTIHDTPMRSNYYNKNFKSSLTCGDHISENHFKLVTTDYTELHSPTDVDQINNSLRNTKPMNTSLRITIPRKENKNSFGIGLANINNVKKTSAKTTKDKKKDEIVEKFVYSKFIFNKDYRNKVDFLDKISSREYNFQKKILGLKKYEKLIVDNFDIGKVKNSCEDFFNNTIKSKTNNVIHDNKKNEIHSNKNKKLKLKIENFFINENVKEKDIVNINRTDVKNRNQAYINKINKDIDNIDSTKKLYEKELRPFSSIKEISNKSSEMIKEFNVNFTKRKEII